MVRYVKRGAKGIALLDSHNGKPCLKHVFDVTDTNDSIKARKPYLWALKPEHMSEVAENLMTKYSLPQHSLLDSICTAVEQLSEGYYAGNEAATTFRKALAVSATHTIISRCSIDPSQHLQAEDYNSILDFKSYESILAWERQ